MKINQKILIAGLFSLVLAPALVYAATTTKKTVKPAVSKVTTTKKAATKTTTKKPTTKVSKTVPQKPVFTYAGWIPYWKKTAGTSNTYSNLKYLDIISPFSYEVTTNGQLVDKLKVDADPWPGLFAEAKAKGVKVYPTISWFSQSGIYNTLSATSTRSAHIAEIKSTILDNPNFNGVDIDYENKSAETKDYFSQFIKDLSVETKATNKKLICTIEARTPITLKYSNPSAELIADSKFVSNDYTVLGKYCDQVRIMTYDQKRYLQVYNQDAAKKGEVYAPVADPRWVEEVIKLAVKEIPAQKIILGVPTYGYKYEIMQNPDGTYSYEYLRAINHDEAFDTVRKYGAEIKRSLANEPYAVYTAEPQVSYLGATGAPTHMITFPDAESMHDKIVLARKYKLGGVAMFKFDGGGDQSTWDIMRLAKSGQL